MSNLDQPQQTFDQSKTLQANARPKVITYYRIYLWLMTIMYLLVMIAGVVIWLYADHVESEIDHEHIYFIQGGMLVILGFVLALVFAFGLIQKYTTFAWVYGIVMISIGLTSPGCVPMAVPLLIFWIKDDTKRWYEAK